MSVAIATAVIGFDMLPISEGPFASALCPCSETMRPPRRTTRIALSKRCCLAAASNRMR
jgi:hypothetical protein